MSETNIPKIEKQDITAPNLGAGDTAIVLQRHERYDRNRTAEKAGSIFKEAAEAAKIRDIKFFEDIMAQEEKDGIPTKVLFVSSNTQYAEKGYRSLETAQLAQDAAKEVMAEHEVDWSDRIINFNDHGFNVERHDPTDQDIQPLTTMVEPKIFDTPDYVQFLRDKYGAADESGLGLSPAAWGAHESDSEKEAREQFGAESVYEMLERTKLSLAVLESVSLAFHEENPDERLVIWVATHYDTISPLVKEATDTAIEEFVPVDYGAGVVIELPKDTGEMHMHTASFKTKVELGKVASSDALAKHFS